MFFFAGLIRSTVLYSIALTLLGHNSDPIASALAYTLLSLIHVGICKLTRDSRTASDIFISALEHDAIAPFLHVKSFLEVLLKKHIIRDAPEHMFEDKMQVYLGGIWGACILLLLVSVFLSQ